jgi:TrmH family RNA methyltransferase
MNPPEISSTTNARVKAWVSLTKRSHRDEVGQFLVEGARESQRLSRHTHVVETIWCEEYAGRAAPFGATTVSARVFDKISRRSHPDGTAVIAVTPDTGLDQFTPPAPSLVLVADGVEKPGNIGAMMRTCDALGAALLASELATDLVNPNVIRAAQGALLAIPTASVDRESAIAWCVGHTQTVVLRPHDSTSVWDIDMTEPTSIVVGAEDAGVGSQWNDIGIGARIPMSGQADSLNASVAAAIVLAEARRQRSSSIATT